MNILQNISLKKFNTFGIDVSAQRFALLRNAAELPEIIKSEAGKSSANTMILGGGSNILFTKNVPGLVIKNELTGIDKIGEDADHIYLKAGAGENWHKFVLYCLENNYSGTENLALIPGNVGASPMQNIGAYGVEIKDVFHSLEAYDIEDKIFKIFNKNECEFGYRDSVFKRQLKNRFIITAVTYILNKNPVFNTSYGAVNSELEAMNVQTLSIQAIAQAVMRIRRSKLPDPAIIGNAGSFFKNPEVSNARFAYLQKLFPGIVGYNAVPRTKLAAGWLIEQCGWKGFTRGDAGCHATQALVLVNYGNASGKDIYDLSTDILNSVENRFGISLEREVNIF